MKSDNIGGNYIDIENIDKRYISRNKWGSIPKSDINAIIRYWIENKLRRVNRIPQAENNDGYETEIGHPRII